MGASGGQKMERLQDHYLGLASSVAMAIAVNNTVSITINLISFVIFLLILCSWFSAVPLFLSTA